MSYKIEEIEGIGSAYAAKLNEADGFTTDDLLRKPPQNRDASRSPKQRVSQRNLY